MEDEKFQGVVWKLPLIDGFDTIFKDSCYIEDWFHVALQNNYLFVWALVYPHTPAERAYTIYQRGTDKPMTGNERDHISTILVGDKVRHFFSDSYGRLYNG